MPTETIDPVAALAALGEDAAVAAAARAHANAVGKLKDAVDKIANFRTAIAEMNREQCGLADAILEDDSTAVKRHRILAEKIAEHTAHVSAIEGALVTAEAGIAVAAKNYLLARAAAAKELAAEWWTAANDLVPEQRELKEKADAVGRRVGNLRAASERVAALATDRPEVPQLRGAPAAVRAAILAPPVGAAFPVTKLLALIAPAERLTEHGDLVECSVVDVELGSPRILLHWRAVATAPLPEALARALGTEVVSQREGRAKELDRIRSDNQALAEEARQRTEANRAEWVRKYGPPPAAAIK